MLGNLGLALAAGQVLLSVIMRKIHQTTLTAF